MTRSFRFADAFWGGDYCSTAGFETLVRKMKDGRQVSKDCEQFFKQRAKIEEEYSKNLAKLARSFGGTAEIGTLRTALDSLRSQTEAIVLEHSETSKTLNEAAVRLGEFNEKQRRKRKAEEESVNRSMNKKKDMFKKTIDSKRSYEVKCREFDQIEHQVHVAKTTGLTNVPVKEAEKLYSKYSKLGQDKHRTDQIYKDCVGNLEHCRLQWEKEMTQACEVFEKLEEERHMYLKNEMWIHTNIISQTCVNNDEHAEEIRKVLEKCDADADIVKFINEKNTGNERPAAIVYEAYRSPSQARDTRTNRTPTNRPPQPLPQ